MNGLSANNFYEEIEMAKASPAGTFFCLPFRHSFAIQILSISSQLADDFDTQGKQHRLLSGRIIKSDICYLIFHRQQRENDEIAKRQFVAWAPSAAILLPN